MSENKRYYWIKLPTIYFDDIIQKKMRKQENGLLLQVIYLRLMLLSCNNNGFIYFQGVYDTLCEEIAETIGEDAEEVETALKYFERNKLIRYQEQDISISQAVELTGSETDSAQRMREMRERNNKASHCDALVTKSDALVTRCDTEKEKEKDIDIEIDKEIDIDKDKDASHCDTLVTKCDTKATFVCGGGYGTKQNIKISDAEYNKLCDLYSKQITDTIINKMSVWIEEHNKPNYPSYETIKEWINKNYTSEDIKKAIMQKDSYDLEQIEKQALKK